ncbi:mannose-6-phosphate isomerase, putative [Plasmodium gallinaceum]|uniref:Mannose-6-phosphate isomerase, putative n=1 Tax=Plasmodium gallinaceum TaxID=5849 RepID=A0A1J1GL09_PLAGA|nr:mannose-6-phosphate isomerase, putative [Plasmodium gallinaceum]CRG93078.1 mannose-6-phosphate isomerase, putative [Plasmodium gallinaceum]
MNKFCINECIPYVQKYDWGRGKDGLVYVVMKNIVKDNYEIIKKEINNLDYLKEYIENDDDNKYEENINYIKQNENYAELWIGSHKKGPNLVVYNNTLIKVEDFLKFYEEKKNKKNTILKNILRKIQNTKKKYLKRNYTTKSEDTNNLKKSNEENGNSNIENSISNRNSLKEENDVVNDDIQNNSFFPYLFKILSISKPLSIQIHPNEKQSLYLNSINPLLYKDKIFKTEMCVCINSMSLLCGFMNIFKIAFLIRNIYELNEFFLNDNKKNKNIDKNNSKSSGQDEELNYTRDIKKENNEQEDINNKLQNNEKENDIFFLFELFNPKENKHIEEILTMLSRIYIYIINYTLRTSSDLNYNIVSIIDNYAECIQKYVFEKKFFYSFYKNENFLEEKLNLSNLIKEEKEKLQKNLKRKKDYVNLSEFDISGKNEMNKMESDENEGNLMKLSKLNIIKEDEKENKVDKNKININTNEHNSNNFDKIEENECFFVERKKIKAFYEHIYKFLIHKILLEDSNVLNNCINSIIDKNEVYISFMNSGENLKRKTEKLYKDACLKKNYEVLCKETEVIIMHSIFDILKNVSKHYMNDGGRIFIFILQLINLNDGDVVYIKPGIIHSYISGHCLECMTNSDLVIRGGLTNKEIDKLNFIKYVNYKNNYPVILEKEFINYNIVSYSYHNMKHFKILLITINPGEKINYLFSEKSFTSCIIMSTNKKVKITGNKNDKKKIIINNVRNGMVLFIAPKVKVSISNFYSNVDDGNKEFVMYCATS